MVSEAPEAMSTPEKSSLPVYAQVANILRSQIVGLEGDRPIRLPNEEQLAETHSVARGTIRQALQILTQEGLIERTRGRGTVTSPAGIQAWRKQRDSRLIKVITSWQSLPDNPASFYGQLYQGILVRGEECGHQVSIRQMGGPFPRIDQRFAPEDPRQVIGAITVCIFDERMIGMHAEAGYPVVSTDYWSSNRAVDSVVFDCYCEGQKAVEFLLGMGHRTIFYLGNNHVDEQLRQHHESDADLMAAGCRRALEEAGLSLPASRTRFCTVQDAAPAAQWFLRLRPRPTAGVIFSSGLLPPFVEQLAGHGVRCPEDISLVSKASTDDSSQATVLRNDPYPMGRLAVDLLLERASGKRTPGMRLALESTLHRGNTTRRLDS